MGVFLLPTDPFENGRGLPVSGVVFEMEDWHGVLLRRFE